jgi:hypothetical protein
MTAKYRSPGRPPIRPHPKTRLIAGLNGFLRGRQTAASGFTTLMVQRPGAQLRLDVFVQIDSFESKAARGIDLPMQSAYE